MSMSARRRLRRFSMILAMNSLMMNNTVMGIASSSIVNGSVDGVATAAKTKIPKMIGDLALDNVTDDNTPTRFKMMTI